MAFVTANPNEYLVVGRSGKVTNRGTGLRAFLWPGFVAVIVPSTKQETLFEMTQETVDGIPLRFKGIVVYRIVDPVAASASFNFSDGAGLEEINNLIKNICLGELRAVVAKMTMQECIEQRKTTLTSAIDSSIRQVTDAGGWGIVVEVVQVAQVFIIDTQLRQQMEAEVRNAIRAKSDQSNIRTQEEVKLAQLESEERVQAQRVTVEKEAIHRKEMLEMAQIASHRRVVDEQQENERQEIALGREKYRLQQAAEQEKIETGSPVELLRLEKRRAILEGELVTQRLENEVHELEVQRDIRMEQAKQELRKEILLLEQPPQIAEALSKVFQGTQLSVYGGENVLLSMLSTLVNAVNIVKTEGAK
jgi:regulator of protease activity HflC (stomatin/prohibitin superfamily)